MSSARERLTVYSPPSERSLEPLEWIPQAKDPTSTNRSEQGLVSCSRPAKRSLDSLEWIPQAKDPTSTSHSGPRLMFCSPTPKLSMYPHESGYAPFKWGDEVLNALNPRNFGPSDRFASPTVRGFTQQYSMANISEKNGGLESGARISPASFATPYSSFSTSAPSSRESGSSFSSLTTPGISPSVFSLYVRHQRRLMLL
jgi:hypothetical protein